MPRESHSPTLHHESHQTPWLPLTNFQKLGCDHLDVKAFVEHEVPLDDTAPTHLATGDAAAP